MKWNKNTHSAWGPIWCLFSSGSESHDQQLAELLTVSTFLGHNPKLGSGSLVMYFRDLLFTKVPMWMLCLLRVGAHQSQIIESCVCCIRRYAQRAIECYKVMLVNCKLSKWMSCWQPQVAYIIHITQESRVDSTEAQKSTWWIHYQEQKAFIEVDNMHNERQN